MLRLNDIHKTYIAGDTEVQALKGISICFRQSEFVSVLGASGCGKTTLLNIIGGLDRYTSGELTVDGRKTAGFSDSDWDSYRNHKIGFIFQSYNLIGHQSVLSNVELALTLSGVSKSERRRRATEMLTRVGLGDQLGKMPNQLSGGQMQRVAIARALVNDPEILLADEPTGALDSENSLQLMELLKEISHDKLIIMVTHNPELAKEYSTRIVRLSDGRITGDTMPYSEEEEQKEQKASPANTGKKSGKVSMSFLTALNLSFRNLMTKKARTILTCFAGSIGIIGIALVLSVSSGVQDYINSVQENTLSSYPVSLEKVTVDYSAMFGKRESRNDNEEDAQKAKEERKIYSNDMMESMLSAFSASSQNNDLASFKEYLLSDTVSGRLQPLVNDIKYSYGLEMAVYSRDITGKIIQANPSTVMESMMSGLIDQSSFASMAYAPAGASGMSVFSEMIDNRELLDSQYDLVSGSWPESENDVVLVIDKDNRIGSLALYTIGLRDQDDLSEIYMAMLRGEDVSGMFADEWSASYDDMVGLEFRLLYSTDFYSDDDGDGVWSYDNGAENLGRLYDDESRGLTLRVSGIIRPNGNATATSISGTIGYTPALSKKVAEYINNSEIVKAQLGSTTDVLTGFEFYVPEENGDELSAEEEEQLEKLMNFDDATIRMMLAASNKTEEEIGRILEIISIRRASAASGTDLSKLPSDVREYVMTLEATERDAFLKKYLKNKYEDNMSAFGVTDESNPTAIYIYPKDFDSKEEIISVIDEYNDSARENNEPTKVLVYTDYIGIFLKSVSVILDVISYVLIAFVSISLVVSSIMIGVITYISVLERTKEIGILRSVGASKRDVSRVFNAETLVVGFTAGMIGILLTLLLLLPINIIISQLSGIVGIASLPVAGAVILVIISMLLTLLAGLVPSCLAAKRDPVVALRSE